MIYIPLVGEKVKRRDGTPIYNGSYTDEVVRIDYRQNFAIPYATLKDLKRYVSVSTLEPADNG